ncbi:MAG: DUF4190 domain-containing protein [Bacteroidia bacterium]
MKNNNKLFALILAAFLIFGGTTYASFPVKNESKKEQSAVSAKEELKAAQVSESDEILVPTEPKVEKKDFNVKQKITSLLNKYLKKANGDWDIFSILGFIFGIVGLAVLPILFGIAAIVLSIIGLKKTSNGKKGKGLAIAGLILGILEVLIIFLLIGVLLAVAAA